MYTKNLKELREEYLGMTVPEFSKATGINRWKIKSWKRAMRTKISQAEYLVIMLLCQKEGVLMCPKCGRIDRDQIRLDEAYNAVCAECESLYLVRPDGTVGVAKW